VSGRVYYISERRKREEGRRKREEGRGKKKIFSASFLILLIQTFSDNLRQSKYDNPIARKGGIPQSYDR
jgi:hypothetical protein